ncbi:MAG: isopentenyl phosphate kinase [Archaeoglobi archaeon]|nr:isopentenyl phosphate kinase family protein [Candidatus Mnemosynella bozhongmuii]MDI3502878.1 isopentenyl phosphate kinase [Archaeoglobi archaeon]MDK2782170.1 isopentenyl phosphate kinase [Archaeoglobi archaeon]
MIVLKIGGSVITEKSSLEKANIGEMRRIAGELAKKRERLILVHGVGSFGHPHARRYSLNSRFHAPGFCATHSAVSRLNHIFVDILNTHFPALSFHPSDIILAENGEIREAFTVPIREALNRGITPVTHGDVVFDIIRGNSIISGDRLVSYLSLLFSAKRIGMGTDVDGVMDERGDVVEEITPESFREIEGVFFSSGKTDVTGEMKGKVLELLKLAERGIESQIFNASVPGNIEKFLRGERVGTLIRSD